MFRGKLSVVPGGRPRRRRVLVAGCSTTKVDKTANWSPNVSTPKPRTRPAPAPTTRRCRCYEKLEGRAAGTPLAQQAQLDKAYAQYKAGDKAAGLSPRSTAS